MNNKTDEHYIINNAQHKAISITRIPILTVYAGEGHAGPSRTSLVLPQIYLTGQQPTVTFSVQYWSRQSTRNSQVQ